MLEIAGGIILAVVIILGLGIAAGIVTLPLHFLYLNTERKNDEKMARERSARWKKDDDRLAQLLNGAKEKHPHEMKNLLSR